MSFPFYPQPDSMDCGPACLRMIASHYGRLYPLATLRERCRIGKEGVSLLGISEAAASIGFRTQALHLDTDTLLREAPLPAILHWKQKHFVVLYRAGRRIRLADPARGLQTLTRSELQAHWLSHDHEARAEGIALLLEPTPDFYKQEDEHRSNPNRLLHYLTPYRRLLIQLLAGLCVGSALQLVLPFLAQSVVDTGIATASLSFVSLILLAQLAVVAGRTLVEFIRGWILLHISTRINVSILGHFLARLMKLPIPFFDTRHTGDILQRMNDHSRIESFLTGTSLNTLFALVNLLVFSVVLILYSPSIFFVFLAGSGLYALWVLLLLRRKRSIDQQRFGLAAREQSAAIQLVQAMQEIRLNGVEDAMRWGWERLQAALFRLNTRSLALNQWQQAGALLVNEGKNLFISYLAARAVIEGHLSLGSMLAIQYMLGQLNSPVEQVIGLLQSWQQARLSLGRLNEIEDVPEEETPGLDDWTEEGDEGIRLTDVRFGYPGAGNEDVLKGIDLLIPWGKTTAIVGASGSGKTTLLKLLLKFYEPRHGAILLDDRPLTSISHRAWRARCGVVMQDSYIFSATLARNIAVGEAPINQRRLHEAIHTANLQGFVQGLPLGVQTMIGAEGNGISMGQRQRILLARAVYRQPRLIFLDEATNSLDASNETTIVQNLARFAEGRTVIVVAHRLSTVRHADQIVVLGNGRVTECGTHDALIERRGDYYQLIKDQLELER